MQQKATWSFLTAEQVFLVRKLLFSLRLTALFSYPDFTPHKYANAVTKWGVTIIVTPLSVGS